MAQHNLPAQSLDPLPKNPTLFGVFSEGNVEFENTGYDLARIFTEVMMGEYGVPLSLRDSGVSMLLMPTGVVIEGDTVKLTYHYAESGGLAVLAVSLTDGACMCEVLHITGGGSEPTNVSWDNITGKPEGIEPAIVVLSGSPVDSSSYTEDIIAKISAAVEANSRLVLEWGSEQVSVDYVEKSSNPVLSFRRDSVSYEVTLDTEANTAEVRSISALTTSNLRDTVGDSENDVMTQKAVTELVKSLGLTVVEVSGDPSLAATWTEEVIETVSTIASNGAKSVVIAAPAEFGSYLSTKFYAYDFSDKHYVEIDYVNEAVKYAVVLDATDKTASVAALPLGGVTKIALDTDPSSPDAWTADIRAKIRAAHDAADTVVLVTSNTAYVVNVTSDSDGVLYVQYCMGDNAEVMIAIPTEDATPVTVSQYQADTIDIISLSGDIAEPASWEGGKQKLRDAAAKGQLPVAMNSSTMKLYRAVVAFGAAGADCAALFVDDNARTVRVNVSNEGVVTCTAHTPLDETSVVQETGAGTDKIMSQDAVTKKLINTLTLTGDVTGTGTPADGSLSVATTIHGAAKTVTLTGAVTGTGTAEDGTATVDTTLSGSSN